MDLGLTDKHALVTGASKGIGLAITKALADEGANVVAGSRTVSDELRQLIDGGQVRQVSVDLSTADGPSELVASALEDGSLDVLVNNVGAVTPRLDGFLSVTDDQWLQSLTLGFMAAVRTTRAVLPGMLEAGGGTIVSTCSVNAFLPDPGVIDYCAAKAALANFSKALSKEVGPRGIRVNTVSPGPVSTGLGSAITVSRPPSPERRAGTLARWSNSRLRRPRPAASLSLKRSQNSCSCSLVNAPAT